MPAGISLPMITFSFQAVQRIDLTFNCRARQHFDRMLEAGGGQIASVLKAALVMPSSTGEPEQGSASQQSGAH